MRFVKNRVYGCKCQHCHGIIDVDEECVQSEAFYSHKWHVECSPDFRRAIR